MELMIAISILSIILLLSSMVLVGIGNLYSKGANLSNVQDTTRNIVENVVSAVQFSGDQLNNGQPAIVHNYVYNSSTVQVSAYCFGQTRYSFVTGFNLPPGWSHILWLDRMSTPGDCFPLDIGQPSPTCLGILGCIDSQSNSGSELIGANMHIATFDITEYNPQLYSVSVGIGFGAKDMFVSNGGVPTLVNGNYQCSDSAGQQYCASSYLTTFASERLSQ